MVNLERKKDKFFTIFLLNIFGETKMECIFARILGLVVQLVRIPACHAGGRGFESRPDRSNTPKAQCFRGFVFFGGWPGGWFGPF